VDQEDLYRSGRSDFGPVDVGFVDGDPNQDMLGTMMDRYTLRLEAGNLLLEPSQVVTGPHASRLPRRTLRTLRKSVRNL
jgi:hypothetical protein